MRVYKIENLDNNKSPEINFKGYLYFENMDEILEEMIFIFQSKKNGNLFVGNYDKETIELAF